MMLYTHSPEVAAALDAGRPVVALESTIITHGMPWPRNLEVARMVEQVVRDAGAVPATIAVLAGQLHIGLTAAELEALAQAKGVAKLSRADLAVCMAQGGTFARLQRALAVPIAQGRLALLSLSFDPDHDGPAQLAEYRQRMGGRGAGWVVARPRDAAGLQAMLRTFGVTAIPDGLGGYAHNAAIHVVDPAGRLVAVTDGRSPDAALAVLARGLAQ